MSRLSWCDYFIGIAQKVSERSTCNRASIGCVLVDVDHNILTSGYNGAISGAKHCIDIGCDLIETTTGEKHCIRTVHSELNAISQAAKRGVSVNNSICYIYSTPLYRCCWSCKKILINSGIREIRYQDGTVDKLNDI